MTSVTIKEFKDVSLVMAYDLDQLKTRFSVYALDLITPECPKAVRRFKTLEEAKALYEELIR